MFERFRTGDAALEGSVTYSLNLPSALWYIAEVADVLRLMTDPERWEQLGSVTIEQATQEAIRVLKAFNPMIGQIVPYISASLPGNCLECDGTVYNRVDYPDLYAMLDSAFKVDADTFRVPDLRGRTIIGVSTVYSTGNTGGETEHTLSTAEMPAHNHTDSGHSHTTGNSLSGVAVSPGELPVLIPNPIPAFTGTGYANISNTGGGEAHNNLQPYIALKYCVVAL